jgi:hypothetical protein
VISAGNLAARCRVERDDRRSGMRTIAVAVVVVGLGTGPAVAESEDPPPPEASAGSQVAVVMQGGALARADGTAAAGAGVALATTSGPVTATLGLTRWTGVEGSDERTWELATRTYFQLPRHWRLRSHFFLGGGLDRTTSSSASGTAGTFEIGFGASLQATDWLSAWCDVSLGKRFWLDSVRSVEKATRTDDESFTKATFGLAASRAY